VNNCSDGGARPALTNEASDQRRRTKRELLALLASVETDGTDSRIDDERTNHPTNERTNKRTHAVVSGRQGRRRRFALRTSLRILNVSVDVVVVVVVVVFLLQSDVPICLFLSSLAAQQCFSLSD
jgi:hypothetical protein